MAMTKTLKHDDHNSCSCNVYKQGGVANYKNSGPIKGKGKYAAVQLPQSRLKADQGKIQFLCF